MKDNLSCSLVNAIIDTDEERKRKEERELLDYDFRLNTPSIVKTMLWTDKGFSNVEDDRLLRKRIDFLKSLSKFIISEKSIHRVSNVDFDDTVYEHKGRVGQYLYTGDYEIKFVYKEGLHYIYKHKPGATFVYYNEADANKDEWNREQYNKRQEYKIQKLVGLKYPYEFYQVQDIDINGLYRNRTTYYFEKATHTWFWVEGEQEENMLYYYITSDCYREEAEEMLGNYLMTRFYLEEVD